MHAGDKSEAPQKKVSWVEKVPMYSLIALAFLLPVFFIPSVSVPFQIAKFGIVYVAILIAFFVWIASRLKDEEFSIPFNIFSGITLAVPLVTILASIFSTTPSYTLLARPFDVANGVFIAALFLMVLLVTSLLKSKTAILYSYLAFFGSFALVTIFHAVRILSKGSFLATLGDVTANTVGKWNDFGIFLGLGVLFTLITLQMVSLGKKLKVSLYVLLVLSLILLLIVNFSIIWYVLGAFSLIFFVYLFSFHKAESKKVRELPVAPLAVLAIAVVAILGNGAVGNYLATQVGASYVEVRPSFVSTYHIIKGTIKENPLFGVGPGNFTEQWLAFKPVSVNETEFWNTDFGGGVGLIPSFIVTTGLIGAVAWLAFIIYMAYLVIKALFSKVSSLFYRYVLLSSSVAALYLWTFSIIYVPGIVVWTLTFFFTGVLVAALYHEEILTVRSFAFKKSPKAGFVYVLALVSLLIATVAASYFVAQKTIAQIYFQKALVTLNTGGNIDLAENYMVRATNLSGLSEHFRTLSQLGIIRINQLASQEIAAESLQVQLQPILSAAIGNAQQAIVREPSNYLNYVALGDVYASVVPVPGAYDQAIALYQNAIELNPVSPALRLTLARLELANNNIPKAKTYITEALQLKNNYTEAIFLLSQIEINQGNIKGAIQNVEAAAVLSPNDGTVFFQLGFLRYSNKDYKGAISALERAVGLVPTYSNAKYFLGLSYSKEGRVKEALVQFKDIETLNPDNQEIKLIISNLEAGKAPLAEAKPPLDTEPEERDSLPINEDAPSEE